MFWLTRELPESVDPFYCPLCGEKPCSICERVLPVDMYSTNGRQSYLKGSCKDCDTKTANAYYEEHREQVIRAVCARYRADPETTRARVRAWKDANPESARVNDDRARLKRRQAYESGFVEDVHPLVLLELDDGVCGICGEDVDPLQFQIDHVWPLSRGGIHAYSNTQVAHLRCNYVKGARIGE